MPISASMAAITLEESSPPGWAYAPMASRVSFSEVR